MWPGEFTHRNLESVHGEHAGERGNEREPHEKPKRVTRTKEGGVEAPPERCSRRASTSRAESPPSHDSRETMPPNVAHTCAIKGPCLHLLLLPRPSARTTPTKPAYVHLFIPTAAFSYSYPVSFLTTSHSRLRMDRGLRPSSIRGRGAELKLKPNLAEITSVRPAEAQSNICVGSHDHAAGTVPG